MHCVALCCCCCCVCVCVSLQVAVIKQAGLPSQSSWVSTLGSVEQHLHDLLTTLSPCVVVVGKVVALPAAWSMLSQQPGDRSQ
jgi:siroheme synthase